jgi:hypothetical protein
MNNTDKLKCKYKHLFENKQDKKEVYDSSIDTQKHINRVIELMDKVCEKLTKQAEKHDSSKLKRPEKKLFDKYTPKLKDCTYGSDEYNEFLDGLKPALVHHYSKNTHHPEHYEDGINGMNLLDIMEMIVDWKAATERHNDGDIRKSVEINTDRFKIEPQLAQIITNTIDLMSW